MCACVLYRRTYTNSHIYIHIYTYVQSTHITHASERRLVLVHEIPKSLQVYNYISARKNRNGS